MKRSLVSSSILWVAVLASASCGRVVPNAEDPTADAGLDRLAHFMTGVFSSRSQSEEDDRFRDVSLAMARVWLDRTDGVWLYLEQALSDRVDEPYRQRIYRLSYVGEDVYRSSVYELPNPETWVGAWREPTQLDALVPESLVSRDGCDVMLRWIDDDTFAGSTLGDLCASDFRGATYATSQVRVTPHELESWDRGFDANGVQVWGSEHGPYRFERSGELPY